MRNKSRLALGGVLLGTLAAGAIAGSLIGASEQGGGPVIQVYKTPTCGCCSDWTGYLDDEGFAVETDDVTQRELNEIKQEAGLDRSLASCHTAFVGDYVVEGHVPAREIRRLLADEPDIAGISVPGMPVGSPGMEVGDRKDPYQVVAFDDAGETSVFARYHQD